MQAKIKILGSFAALAFAVPAFSVDMPKALRQSDCLACHAPDKKVVGPSFLDIAKRYRGKGMNAVLVKRLKSGTAKHTPHKYTSNADLRTAVDWIVQLTPSMLQEPAAGSGMSLADQAEKIIKGSDCFACHKMDAKLIGPSYKEVRAKYSMKDVDALVKKVKEGGTGVWGSVPMTAHPNLSDEDIKTVVTWILDPSAGGSGSASGSGEASSKAAPKADKSSGGGGDLAAKADAIIKTSDCLACHKVDGKLVGPSYKEVAKKYAGQDGAVDLLVKKVKEGGTGVWGPIPMTPHPNMKDEDVRTLVEWIMSLK